MALFCPRPGCPHCGGTGTTPQGIACECLFPRDKDGNPQMTV